MVAKIMVFKPVVKEGANEMYLDEINSLMCSLRAYLYINKIPYVYDPPKPGDIHHIATIKILHEDFDDLNDSASQYVIEFLKNDLISNLAINVQDS
jgi:hypothetical protein